MTDEFVSRGISRGVSVSGEFVHETLTAERLHDIALKCNVVFNPLSNETLDAQRERFVRLLEERISTMLAYLLELDTGLQEEGVGP